MQQEINDLKAQQNKRDNSSVQVSFLSILIIICIFFQSKEVVRLRERLDAMIRASARREKEVERIQESSRYLVARSQRSEEALLGRIQLQFQ